MIGVVGSDFDTNDKLMFEEHKIDTSGLIQVDGQTFRWSGAYMEDINNAVTIDTQLNVFRNFEPVLSDAHANAPYLFLANIDPKLQLKVLDSMNGRPKMVANDTLNLWIEISRPSLIELISNVDSIFINEEEAKQLTGKDHLPDAANSILEMGPESTVIKRGEY